MANVLGLALKISADASQLKLTPVERALQTLGKETEKVTSIFNQFASDSDAAAAAQQRANRQFVELQEQLKSGAINAQQFAERYAALGAAVNREAEAFRRAAQITEQNISPLEKYRRTTAELAEQLKAGRISQDTFNRAMQKAQGDLDRTGRSAKQADGQLAAMARQLTTISRIQIGRAIVDGFQVLGGLFRNITGQLQSVVSGVTSSIDELDKLSQRTDISVESLQSLSLAAKLSGVEAEGFATAVTRLGVSIGRANQGDAFDKSLRSLNLTLADLRGLAPEQQFSAIAQQIGALPTSAERAAAAVEVFGKQGAALVPLFRQGAASVDELTKRAERLGVVLRQDQVSSITQLNDTFDLVSATVQGIIGQVAGNLAPLVTAIAEEFLAFVETFQSADGSGGTAIADAITDSLLTGAKFLAGVFDFAVKQLSGFSATFQDVVDGFAVATSLFKAVVSAADALFNLGRSIVSAVTFGVGKVLEQIGRLPFLKDLRESGKALADAAFEQLEQNADRFVASIDRSVGSVGEAIFGETPAEAGERGAGSAEQYIDQFRSKVEEARSPVFRVESDIEKTREAFDDFFGGVVDQSSRVTELMREFEASVAAAREDGELTGDEIARIEELQKRVNAAIQQEQGLRADARATAQKQAEEDGKRLESLLKTTDAAGKITEDLAAVEREIARIQQQIAETGVGEDGAAQARLEQLRTLQTQLDDQLEAAAQGFDKGFEDAFAKTGAKFNELSAKAGDFGQAGAEAARKLSEGITAAQEQARDGILNREAYERQVAEQQRFFEQELEGIKKNAEERRKVNEFVDQQLLTFRFGNDKERAEAGLRAVQIEQEIARVTNDIRVARQNGDQEAINAGITRVQQLEQVQAREVFIASGRQKLEEEIGKQREKYLQQLAEQQKKAEEEQKKFAEERAKAVEAENQRQAARIRELNTLGAGVIGGSDIRTSEGAALFLQLAASRQDPALIEARLQTRRLTEVRDAVVGLASAFPGSTVRIGGGVG